MPRKPPPVLDDNVKLAIDREVVSLRRLLSELDQYTACGIDCEQYKVTAQYYLDQFARISDTFFRGR